MPYLKVYNREIVDDRTYPSALARSVHFAVSIEGGVYEPLNYNYGILYPEAEISVQDTILERGAKSPKIIRYGGYIYIAADFVDAAGNVLDREKVYVWKTVDFTEFEDCGAVFRKTLSFALEDCRDILIITLEEFSVLLRQFTKLRFSHIRLPERVEVSDASELEKINAEVVYTDGSSDVKPVRWNLPDAFKAGERGEYTISGEIVQRKFPYPSACGFADPVVFHWKDKWYFLATNDNTGDVGLYVRGADTVEGLFAEGSEPSIILPYDEKRDFVQTFWAPEFHVIGGELYILFAVGGKQWSPHSHMMKLKPGGDILKESSWEEPVRVVRADGSDLAPHKITLDMTYFRFDGRSYLCWSQRRFDPDSGSMLYIAEIDEKKPWQLKSEPVLLSRPLYGWENQNGTVNNEGPYPLIVGDKIYLSYSGGAAGGYSYVVGYLTAESGSNLLDPKSWKKTVCPVSSSVMFSDREGPAHNSFFVGEDKKTYFACHAQRIGEDNRRNTSITRVQFGAGNRPVLGLEPEEDLPEERRHVSISVGLI